MSELSKEAVSHELAQAPGVYRELMAAATPELLRQQTSGTRWTNREMLFHILLGYGLTRILLPLVSVMDRLPSWAGRAFAALLNAVAPPFHVVNYVGSVIGGRLLTLNQMVRLLDRGCAALNRRLRRQGPADLARTMPFPTRWDPFFTEQMSVLDLYHYPWQHFAFHRSQLTIDPGA